MITINQDSQRSGHKLYEIRAAAGALRIRRLVEDRTAFAATIAHERVHEIEGESARSRVLVDLEQMRRMITVTLEFARLDFAAEPARAIDLFSLVQSLCHDLSDAGQDITINAGEAVNIRSKPTSLRRALSNLLDNAVKYGRRARVEVTSTAREVRILIKDE